MVGHGVQVYKGAKVVFQVKPFSTVLFPHLFPGKFGGDPGDTEHHRDQPTSAHCTGGLSEPAHGKRGQRTLTRQDCRVAARLMKMGPGD